VPGGTGPVWVVEEHTHPRDSADLRYAFPGDTLRLRNRQPGPPVTMLTGTQPGHAVTITTTGTPAAQNLNDTSDFLLGSQSVSFSTNATNAETDAFRRDIAVDMTGKGFVFFVEFGNQTAGVSKIDVQLPSGDGNFTGIIFGGAAYTADQQYLKDGEWGRFFVPFSQISAGFRGGSSGTTMSRAAITSIRLRVYNLAGQQVPAKLNGIGTYPEPVATFPNGVVSFVYDDSYSSQYATARPHLDKYGYRATAYPITGRIDSGASYMTMAQLRKLHDQNGWEIGAHATTDAIHALGLTGLSSTDRAIELKALRDWQIANGFADSSSYAYPRGSFDAASISEVGKYWESARTTYAHSVEIVGTPYPYRLRSFNVGGWTTTQRRTMVDVAKQGRAWTIFLIHAIVSTVTDSQNDILVADHQDLVDYVASSGVPVLPVGEVMRAGVPV
jgi:peptidoglycan/xylan/chitin deacetylase (PgdA/CDA1 family)